MSLLSARLLRDVSFTCGSGCVADAICQHIEKGNAEEKAFDWRRNAAFAAFTGFYIGGACSALYATYPRVAARLLGDPSPTPKAVGAVSTLLDNFVHVPFVYLPSFFLGTSAMRGHDWEEANDQLRRNWSETCVSCWGFWLPTQYYVFSVLPPAYRIRAVATGDFVWNIILSYLAHRDSKIAVDIAEPVQRRATSPLHRLIVP